MEEKELMIIVALALNSIATCIILGEIKLLEKRKKDTPYNILFWLAYPIIGFGVGTVLSYIIKYF